MPIKWRQQPAPFIFPPCPSRRRPFSNGLLPSLLLPLLLPLLLLVWTAAFVIAIARRQITAEALLNRAKSNSYKDAHPGEDSPTREKHVDTTKKDQNSALNRYVITRPIPLDTEEGRCRHALYR
jgi:hypothetical protein